MDAAVAHRLGSGVPDLVLMVPAVVSRSAAPAASGWTGESAIRLPTLADNLDVRKCISHGRYACISTHLKRAFPADRVT